MSQSVREVMTADPITLAVTASVVDAARRMKADNIGDVLVVDGDRLWGVLTDRDIVIRAVAEGRDPSSTTLGEISSAELVTVGPADSVDDAVRLMSQRAVRRLPVIDGQRAIGIVSIGDLALDRDPTSALADISAAAPNT